MTKDTKYLVTDEQCGSMALLLLLSPLDEEDQKVRVEWRYGFTRLFGESPSFCPKNPHRCVGAAPRTTTSTMFKKIHTVFSYKK